MTAHPADAIDREREYWNAHAEFDWMDDRSKRETIAMLPALRGDVLELCIGSGLLVDQIPRTYASYTGLDISQPLLDTLHRRMPDLTLLQGDAEELPFEDRRFDAVLVFAGLHHLPHYKRSIHHAFRVLRPGGVFVCFEPNKKAWYRTPMWALRDVIGIYTDDEVVLDPGEVEAALRHEGFVDVRTRFSTPRLKPSFLKPMNRVLARAMYAAAALGDAAGTQSFFLTTARRP
jgi:ubiquinone/menaquinone biosynthesis C-methylase UbiE